MALAIFDLDHTLLDGDSDHAFGQFLVDQGMVDPQVHKHRNDHFYQQYKAGTLDIHEYLEFALRPLTEYSLQEMLDARQTFLQERVVPLISQKSRDLIAHHKRLGDTLLIITATNGFVTYPIAELLGIEHIIAPHGKVIRLQDWLAEQGFDLTGSWFYSDSHNDLPLLEVVEHPVAVDPDERLEAIARERGWPIISLRD